MRTLTAALILAPAAALAHEGPAGHAHPHGLEGLALVAVAAVAVAVIWAVRRARR